MTHRMEPFFSMWLKELTSLRKMGQRIEPFLNTTHRIEFFLISLKELNLFFLYDSQNWTLLFKMTHRIEPFSSTWLLEIEPFFQHWLVEIEPTCFEHDSENGTHLFNMTQRNEPFFHVSMNWSFFLNMTQRIELFLNMTQRTEFFFNVTRAPLLIVQLTPWRLDSWVSWIPIIPIEGKRIEPLFLIWLEELNFYSDPKSWICCSKCLKELNRFF